MYKGIVIIQRNELTDRSGTAVAVAESMDQRKSHSDQFEERLVDFAVRIITLASALPRAPSTRHIALQVLRSGTAGAANYAEARGAESRSDFIHKMGIVQKELNETSVWLRILSKIVAEKKEDIIAILAENQELARIITASVKTAKTGGPRS